MAAPNTVGELMQVYGDHPYFKVVRKPEGNLVYYELWREGVFVARFQVGSPSERGDAYEEEKNCRIRLVAGVC